MRLAVLADIHGNLQALEAVLEDSKDQNVNGFIIAGDLIGDGPQPAEVLKRIKELNGWVIKGNREEYTLKYNDGMHKEWENCNQMFVAVWTQKCLDSSEIAYIRNLQEQLVVNIAGTSPIRVVHGSPFDIYEHLCPNKHRDKLVRAVRSIDESVLVCGHTHEAWSELIDGKLVVNPGSVGIHFNPKCSSEYSILSWDGEQWLEEHRYVKYDFSEVEESYKMAGLFNTGGAIWAKAIMLSIKTGRNIAMGFLEFAYNFARKEGMGEQKLIPNELWERAAEAWDWELIKKR